MSYVDLKHMLADLTMEVVADPERYSGGDRALDDRLIQLGILAREGDRAELRQDFRPHQRYFEQQTGRLRSFLAKYRAGRPPAETAPDPLWAGVLLFNEGLYFECHEWLEAAWKRSVGPERNFLHGIVQAAAAFYHYEKGNMHGARTLLGKALRRLETYPSPYLSVDLDDLSRTLTQWQTEFAQSDGPRPDSHHPTIRFARR
jgi:hypothetical protein